MGDKAHHRQLRVEGFVLPGSIEQNGTNVTFRSTNLRATRRRPPEAAC